MRIRKRQNIKEIARLKSSAPFTKTVKIEGTCIQVYTEESKVLFFIRMKELAGKNILHFFLFSVTLLVEIFTKKINGVNPF